MRLSPVLQHRRAMLEDARARYQATKRRLESAAKESDKMEAVAQEREKELLTEESRLKEMDKELRNKKEALFRENQAKFKLKQEEKTLDAELSGARSSLKNLNAKIHHLDQESLRQQELIYNADFQIQQMERKVARASGERSDEEKKALQARIAELQENLDGITAQVNMLQSQCKRLQEDLRATKRHKVCWALWRGCGASLMSVEPMMPLACRINWKKNWRATGTVPMKSTY